MLNMPALQGCVRRCAFLGASCGVRSLPGSFTPSSAVASLHCEQLSARRWAQEGERRVCGQPSMSGSSCCPRIDMSD